ncbi:hypothetical protein JG491_33555 [Streptomyces sp. CRPSP2-6A1]|uniref:hypothetical protein n=1 Tax=Streptomyces TaxID=1883 RepID=UPI0018F0C163|nr:hypothetical protein [Streptomyces sp. CRPSP2-6A1]MBJ7004932.1 hypothetical protein [Streptomyces sp. CRPSP2-6A1]
MTALRIPTGTPLLTYHRANSDRRSMIMVASNHHTPVWAAIELDGSLSKRMYTNDPPLPGTPVPASAPDVSPESLKALGSDTIHLAHALRARQAALEGGERLVDRFALEVLGRRGARWREAVSTALVGDWVAPLKSQGTLPWATG